MSWQEYARVCFRCGMVRSQQELRRPEPRLRPRSANCGPNLVWTWVVLESRREMMSSSHIQTLRAMLREEKGVILPGAPNALAARIIADLGFKAVYLTGAGLTNMHLGLPDLGFIDLRQVADHVMVIRCVIEPHRTSEFRSTLLAIAGRDLQLPLQVIQCAHEYL